MSLARRLSVATLRSLRHGLQVLASPIAHARRPPRGVSLVAFRGFGSPQRVCIAGQVTEALGGREPPAGRGRDAGAMARLRMARRLLLSREIPRATVEIAFGPERWQTTTDANGFFFTCRTLPPLPPGPMWQPYEIGLAAAPGSSDPAPDPPCARGTVLVAPRSARRIVVSDIDDTVVRTGVANKLAMLWRLFAMHAHERSPFPGIAALYRALHAGPGGNECNPILYVSRSPWSLYPILEELFAIHRIPVGPVLLLRDWGVTYRHPFPQPAPEHKRERIEDILAVDSEAPVVLIGDSGQRDPEVYTEVARRHPGRVAAIYIRDLEPGGRRSRQLARLAADLAALGIPMIAARDTLQLAADALARGWIHTGHLAEIGRDATGKE